MAKLYATPLPKYQQHVHNNRHLLMPGPEDSILDSYPESTLTLGDADLEFEDIDSYLFKIFRIAIGVDVEVWFILQTSLPRPFAANQW